MRSRFDDISRILAAPIPRRQAFALAMWTLAGVTVADAMQQSQSDDDHTSRHGSFRAYVNAISQHLRQFVRFVEPDRATRRQILEAYERATELRELYQTTGIIANDPLVEVVQEGDNLFGMGNRHVVILLSADPTLEASDITITKPRGNPAHIVLIGGNPGFWLEESPAAKFVSATFTLPEAESTLTLASSSFSIAKVVVVVGVATVAVAVATRLHRRSTGQDITGRRCECTYTCTARDGRTFPYVQRKDCCDPVEAMNNTCPGRCPDLSFTNGTTCTHASSVCVADATCETRT
jgi:hypothetical protein